MLRSGGYFIRGERIGEPWGDTYDYEVLNDYEDYVANI
jgi:hypothetical protein